MDKYDSEMHKRHVVVLVCSPNASGNNNNNSNNNNNNNINNNNNNIKTSNNNNGEHREKGKSSNNGFLKLSLPGNIPGAQITDSILQIRIIIVITMLFCAITLTG